MAETVLAVAPSDAERTCGRCRVDDPLIPFLRRRGKWAQHPENVVSLAQRFPGEGPIPLFVAHDDHKHYERLIFAAICVG